MCVPKVEALTLFVNYEDVVDVIADFSANYSHGGGGRENKRELNIDVSYIFRNTKVCDI